MIYVKMKFRSDALGASIDVWELNLLPEIWGTFRA
jgi:hypothetical protein